MKWVLFCHSLLSDWNHGNAHFLRGVVTELQARGHDVHVYEPRDAWSLENLVRDHGRAPLEALARVYPDLPVTRYDPGSLEVARAVDGADVVVVHEWSDPAIVAAVGRQRRRTGRFRALFHDTHHRSASAPEEMARYDLSGYDGALVFGEAIREIYLVNGWAERVWTWHEAADTRVFRPIEGEPTEGDLLWVGNWGDDERTAELQDYLLDPVRDLGLRASVHGVRYPDEGLRALERAGIAYRGWIANHEVPRAFARHRMTVHVPRRWYVERLPGIPTIRPFEAMACGIPLISAPWDDSEGLFQRGIDHLVARDGEEMRRHMHDVLNDAQLARDLASRGLQTIQARHTCAHRVDELIEICSSLGASDSVRTPERGRTWA